MFHRILFCIAGLFCNLNLFAQQWTGTVVPHGRSVNAIHIFNQNNIVVAGGNIQNDALQSVFLSNNSGLTWDVNQDLIAPMINSMDFFNDSIGFAVGNEGILLKSSNGGQNWTPVSSGISRQLNDVKYLNDSTIIAVGGNDNYQTIIISTDSGNNWTVQQDIFGPILNSIYFTDRDNGVAVGDNTILITDDGGLNWIPVSAPIIRDFNSVVFANSSIGYIAGGDTAGIVNRTILKTINGGNSWAVISDENAAPFYDIFFLNPDTGYVVGDSSKVLKTVDGGNNWISQNLNITADSLKFNCVEFLNDNFGIVGGGFGRLLIFSTVSPPHVTTTGAVVTNMTNANLGGAINGNGNDFLYSFIFDTDSNLSNNIEAFGGIENNNSSTFYSFDISGLINDTTYYYCVISRNIAGFVSGDTIPFYTGSIYNSFATLPATQITSTTARLNAEISGLIYPASLTFEYGYSELFGDWANALPAQISDTLPYQIYADISNLQQDTYYYFRIKGTLPNGAAIYGQTLYFYNGENTIPNFDFQLWDTVQAELPNGWSFIGNNFQKVTGNTGNYALKIYGEQIALLGNLVSSEEDDAPAFRGGTPFQYRPDSVELYVNYYVRPQDTAYILIDLYSDPESPVSLKFYPITGNSAGLFEHIVFELDYQNSGIPDTLIIGLIPTNPFDEDRAYAGNNFIIIDDISFGSSAPDFSNSDFENWRVEQHELVSFWGPHSFAEYPGAVHTESLVNSIGVGDFALQLKNKLNSSGENNTFKLSSNPLVFNDNAPSFPVNARHIMLNGIYKCQPLNNDTIELSVFMFKNGEQIGFGTFEQWETVSEFSQFSVPIFYSNEQIPDSATIKISAYKDNAQGESILIVDKLAFDNPGILVDDGHLSETKNWKADIFPNPGGDNLNIRISEYSNQPITVELFSASGIEIYKNTFSHGQLFSISTLNFSRGVYFVKLSSVENAKTYKWIKK